MSRAPAQGRRRRPLRSDSIGGGDRLNDVQSSRGRSADGPNEFSLLLAELEGVRDQLAAAEQRIAKLEQARDRSRRAIRRLATMATTDVLTKVGNRRRFEAVLGEYFTLSTRHGSPLSVVLVDVDVFKSYNDAFGHL